MEEHPSDLHAEADARLRELARIHRVDWEPLKRQLLAALEEQSQLEELAEGHSCETAGWESVAGDLEQRRTKTLEAVDRVLAEMLEVDDGLFDGISPDECRHTLSALRGVLERALTIRAESARFILTVGNTARDPAHPDGAVVTNALRRMVEFLCNDESGPRLPRSDALTLAAALAQASGVIPGDPPDPVAALRDRLDNASARTTDLKTLFNSRQALADARLGPGMTFEEIARRTQAIALGLWPDDPARDR